MPHLFEVVGPGPEPSCEESAPADGAQEDVACTQPDPSPAKVLKAWPMPAAESASEFPQELRALLQMELEVFMKHQGGISSSTKEKFCLSTRGDRLGTSVKAIGIL